MTHKMGIFGITIRILVKMLILLSMPVFFMLSQWDMITQVSHFAYVSYLFQAGSSTYVDVLIPDVDLYLIWNPPEFILSILLVALPSILFNLYLARSQNAENLGKVTILVVAITVCIDFTRLTLIPPTILIEIIGYSSAWTAAFPWVLTIMVFFPLLFRQTSILDLQKTFTTRMHQKLLRRPSSNWFLTLILGIFAVFASPFLFTSYYGGSMYGMFSAVGTISFATSPTMGLAIVDVSFSAYPSILGFIFVPMFIPGYAFAFQILRYCAGRAKRTSTIFIGLLSWAIPYLIIAIQFLGTGIAGQMIYPFPILLMIGGLVLLNKKPITPMAQAELDEIAVKIAEELETDERAPEVKVPILYHLWSRLKASRLNPMRK